jgi:sialate O-acetylesterase
VPAEDVGGSWVPATRRTVFGFSAVAYTFAKELHRVLKVPVGILHSSWSATPAESWVRREALLADPTFANAVRRYEDSLGNFTRRQDTYHRALRQYSTSVFKKDEKNTGYHDGWADPNHDTAFWTRVQLPGGWEQAQGLRIDGAVWYRRNIMVPEDWIGKELVLELGTIDDYDNTYFNGFPVGSIRDEVAEPGKVKRVYRIAPGLVRRGMNTIAVRVFDRFGAGGFTGDVDDMKLRLAGNTDDRIMDLAGSWFQRIERRLEQTDTATLSTMPTTPVGPGHPQAPGGLWNGMIAPLIPFGIRGVIWYQGESNATRASQYRRLFPMLINDWRRQWGQGDMPFYYVQLANFRNRKPDPGDSDWAELREAQFQALRLPNTGMAVAIDVGEANDIHPKNKREVGRRLALQALARDYDQKVLRTGPLYSSNRVQGTSIQVFFEGVGERLKTSDGKNVRGFAIAGADRKFVWAEARISGNSVLVSSPRVPKPVAVRYGWADNPDVNLVDSSGLPASPFRTDDWPGITR